jgi:hypothetical protein
VLTDRDVAATACAPEQRERFVFDGKGKGAVPGFAARITASGSKTFVLQYTIGGLRRRLPLGSWPSTPVIQARRLAAEAYRQVRAGHDPWGERAAATAAAVAADRAARAQSAADALTLGVLIDRWEALHLAQRREATRRDATGRLRFHLASWLTRPAAEVTKAEAVQRLDEIAVHAPIAANRTLAYARSCYSWAVKRDLLATNPFDRVAAPAIETSRDRVLSDSEIASIWRAANMLQPVHASYVKTLVLTLQRRSEVGGMAWDELAADLTIWRLPSRRAKNSRAIDIVLTEPVQAALASIRRAGCYVFGLGGRTPLTTGGKLKRALDAAVAQDRADAGLPNLSPWRIHDLRRTGATILARLGHSPYVIDLLLNHATGSSLSGIASIYQRHTFEKERAAALVAWATHVKHCAEGGSADNVVEMGARRRTQR